MIIKKTVTYQCDAQYCSSKINVKPSGKDEYQFHDEAREMERRGWKTWGFKTYCKNHKELAK